MPEKAKQEMFGLMGGTVKKANIGLIIWRTLKHGLRLISFKQTKTDGQMDIHFFEG